MPQLAIVVTVLVFLASPRVALAQLRVISSGGIRAAYDEALPAFERDTNIKVSTRSGSSQRDGPTTIAAQLRAGTPAAVVLMSPRASTRHLRVTDHLPYRPVRYSRS